MTKASVSLSVKAFYWKKPLFGRAYWNASKLELLENGWLIWSKNGEKKGSACLSDIYDEIKLVHADERKFFNAVPVHVRLAPYVLLIPIMRVSGGIEEEICFVLESEKELLNWLKTAAKTLDATDLFEEEKRRAYKELSPEEARTKRLVLPSAWHQFKNALKSMDGCDGVRISWKDV